MDTTRAAVHALLEGRDLSRDEAREVMLEIMRGDAGDSLIGAYLALMRRKGETVDEIAGSAEAMRAVATGIEVPPGDVVDTCGTGGDGLHTINISTGAAIVAAAAGCTIAKHGNRAVSSRSGSADVLEALGVNVTPGPEVVARCVREVGVGFLFAPGYHGAMKHAMPSRQALGARTLFNLLGPLTNPAGANRQLVGVYDRAWVPRVAEVLGLLGSTRALVAHGADGMDEITITGPTHLAEWRDGAVHEFTFDPADLGVDHADAATIAGGTAEENAVRLLAILDGRDESPARDVVLLNAGAVLYVCDLADTIEAGYHAARDTIGTGAARNTLDRLVAVSQGTA
jgi:anthranilate phosphoribosyltransferase